MKRLILIIALIAFSVSAAFSQHICARAGLNITKFISDANIFTTVKPGANAGATVDLSLGKDFFFRPGMMFTMKGAHYDNSRYDNLNYLELPLLMAYKERVGHNMAVDFQTGPYLSVGISGKINKKAENYAVPSFVNEYRKFDFGWNFGMGLDINRFTIGISYDCGLYKLRDHYYSQDVQKNGCLMINFGYYFL